MKSITEDELAMLLGGEAVASTAGEVVFCKGREIGTCSDQGFLARIKCQQKRHDRAAMESMMETWSPSVRDIYRDTVLGEECQVCRGKGFIEMKTKEGRLICMSALIFCAFGGINLRHEVCKRLLRGVV